MKIEREVKLAAWGGFVVPPLDGVAGGVAAEPLGVRILDATYYDTADLRLARAGVSLRHRLGDDPPWTVKLPDRSTGRGEDHNVLARPEISFAGPAGTVPTGAASLVRAWTRSERLRPVARLKTRRSGVALVVGGERVGEVVDDEVSVYQSRRLTSRFREVEVEVSEAAPPGLLGAVVGRLRSAGAGNPETTSKIARALGPLAGGPPDVAPVALRPDASIAEVVAAAIANALERIVAHDAGVRLGDDPEDVHQARVGTRRLRSDLRTFRPRLDPEWVAGLRAEAGWYAGLLGEVRDVEVLAERFERLAVALPETDRAALGPVLARLAAEREEARVRLLAAMDEPRYVAFLDRLVLAAASPVLARPEGDDALPAAPGDPGAAPAVDVLPGLVRRPWRRLDQAVLALAPEPADADLHAVRILAKHARYAAEAAVGVFGRPAARFARELAALQTVLGDHQDACVAEDWLRRAGAGLAGEGVWSEALAVGELIGAERAEAAATRARWRGVWRRVADRRLRRWLRDR